VEHFAGRPDVEVLALKEPCLNSALHLLNLEHLVTLDVVLFLDGKKLVSVPRISSWKDCTLCRSVGIVLDEVKVSFKHLGVSSFRGQKDLF